MKTDNAPSTQNGKYSRAKGNGNAGTKHKQTFGVGKDKNDPNRTGYESDEMQSDEDMEHEEDEEDGETAERRKKQIKINAQKGSVPKSGSQTQAQSQAINGKSANGNGSGNHSHKKNKMSQSRTITFSLDSKEIAPLPAAMTPKLTPKRNESGHDVVNRELREVSVALDAVVDKFALPDTEFTLDNNHDETLKNALFQNRTPVNEATRAKKNFGKRKKFATSKLDEENEKSDNSEDEMLYEQQEIAPQDWFKGKSSSEMRLKNRSLPRAPPSGKALPPLPPMSKIFFFFFLLYNVNSNVHYFPPPPFAISKKKNSYFLDLNLLELFFSPFSLLAKVPAFKAFRLQQGQQEVFSNPNILQKMMAEMGTKASFFTQQNILTVHLHGDPTDKIWKQIEDTLSKYTGKLVTIGQSDVV
ncbi:hypothetical protein RFI_10637 [Reticulomyxa filosa]|uniref:Uncharacterized protein n=1 Tax=Reticulomyxa filosa TaxID=46433 RepID=X6NLB5_RETFI|nr:hypothetical protein RFI_10637 [Reticulomyxa filosa]|eukprot:ETO26499.1 hypothetical protein RFI_10637 [Reticulomyxa filosa]